MCADSCQSATLVMTCCNIGAHVSGGMTGLVRICSDGSFERWLCRGSRENGTLRNAWLWLWLYSWWRCTPEWLAWLTVDRSGFCFDLGRKLRQQLGPGCICLQSKHVRLCQCAIKLPS